MSYPGGTLETTRYQYDAANRLTRIEQDGPTGTLAVTYTWDGAGRLTEKRLPNGLRQRYTWDAANQLTRIDYLKTDGTQLASLAYDYDGAGRRIRKSGNLPSAPETPIEADYDTANRMTRITLNPGTQAAATYDLSYDPQGSLTQKQNRADPADTTTYTWDARNRLAAVTATRASSTSSASFRYDALGRRMERTVQTGTETHTTRYVYDGPQAIGELYDGRLAATNLTGLAIDEAIARTVNVETASSANPIRTKTLITDALGSVLAQTGADQTAEIWYAYSPYGETQSTGSDPDSPQNPSQYTGRENDGAIGGTGGGQMYYYRARFYDPVGKRFGSEDPIGLVGGLNVYALVGGTPLNRSDPFGLFDIANPAEWPTPPQGLVDYFEGFGSYYGGLWHAGVHMYRRAGFAGSCWQKRAIENESALGAGVFSLAHPIVRRQALSAAKYWATGHKAYLGGRFTAGAVTSSVTGVGIYGGLSLGVVAGFGDALNNVDRANAASAEQILRGVLGDNFPHLPDFQRTNCGCSK
ncbi:MAG: hypothetical protein JNM98_02060 [Rhodocyclaceae bacterium]|nr:hypothetical protein [Rhodocyclaceae bacterium]